MRAVQLCSKTWNKPIDVARASDARDGSRFWHPLPDERSQQLGDDKNLSEHLKLPIQRINDYQLLLKWELVRQPTPPGKLPDHSKLSILTCLLSTDVNKKLEPDFLFGF
uniref:DH domain-containing protein n=1 Tax=Timema genevievae TaxID=629358 RepID=A0A7R9PIE7_TIMGE|nr:unnamed protein product [Timema genevievae]